MKNKTIEILKTMFPIEAIIKATYGYIDKYYIHISENHDNWLISFKAKSEVADMTFDTSEFENEIISQAVRLMVYKKTHSIREMLFARAMTSTMVDSENPLVKIQNDQNSFPDGDVDEILKDWFDKDEK